MQKASLIDWLFCIFRPLKRLLSTNKNAPQCGALTLEVRSRLVVTVNFHSGLGDRQVVQLDRTDRGATDFGSRYVDIG